MRGVVFYGTRILVVMAAVALSGCLPSTGTPARLYPIASEMDVVRTTQEDLVAKYNTFVFSAPDQAKLIRNEIIAQRMFAIDVLYIQYENALTREGQEVNFGALATAGALSTASTLFTPVVTKSVLSGVSTVILGTKGFYDSEVLLSQSIRTIQKQMRASRNLIAANISAKVAQRVTDYPLSAALSDLEEYYAAGTLTTGVIDTSTTVGIREEQSKLLKQDVTQVPANLRASVLQSATTPIPPSPRLPPINPQGVGPIEQRLLPSVIMQLQRVVCLTADGKFSQKFHTLAITHLNKTKQKDPTVPPDVLSARDVVIMQDENDRNVKDCNN
jgi:hypothetical protein